MLVAQHLREVMAQKVSEVCPDFIFIIFLTQRIEYVLLCSMQKTLFVE